MSGLRKLFRKKKRENQPPDLEPYLHPAAPAATLSRFNDGCGTPQSHINQGSVTQSSLATVQPLPNKLIYAKDWCTACANIPQELFTAVTDLIYPLKSDTAALVASAASGCQCCSVILQYARLASETFDPRQDVSSPFSVTVKERNRAPVETLPISLVQARIGYPAQLRKPISRNGFERFEVRLLFGEPPASITLGAMGPQLQLRLYSHEPEATSKSSSVDTCNDSKGTFEIASRLIELCTAYHQPCRARQDPTANAPSRLLYVGTVEQPAIQLIETAGYTVSDLPYVSLSHCWGPNLDEVAVTTKTTNLAKRLEHVSIEELSRTFIESIEITRRLQLQYIWIDALCICQDSLEDWRIVSATMASVYVNSVFTLAASASTNSTEGLYRSRDSSITTRLLLAWRDDPGRQILLAPPMVAPCHDTGPLSTRGWCYQERKLPPRVLHFTNTEIYWECECFKMQESQMLDAAGMMNASGPPPPAEWRGDKMGQGDEHPYYHRWRETFEEYSRRNLTRDTDRLVAISGVLRAYFIDQILNIVPQEVYLAGHFKGDFIDSISWTKDNFFPGRMRRTNEYVAPSWSWASVIGVVRVEQIFQDFDPPELLDAGVALAGSDLFGQVVDGYALLKGCLRPAWAASRHINDVSIRPHRFFIRIKDYFTTQSIIESQKFLAPRYAIFDNTGNMCGQVYFDDPADEVDDNREIFCLKRKVARETDEEARLNTTVKKGIDPNTIAGFEVPPAQRGVLVLVLRRVVGRGNDTYRRIGVGALYDPDWFDGIGKTDFTMI